MKNLNGIEKALRDGCHVRGFLSGGRLRVVRIELNHQLKGYGEHPNVMDALSHANEDYLAGGRPYDKVYGGSKPHYVTGSHESNHPLDRWLLQGSKFDGRRDQEHVVVQLEGYAELRYDLEAAKLALEKAPVYEFTQRGFVYHVQRSGDGFSAHVVPGEPRSSKKDPWMWEITKTGHGKSFWEAANAAFEAPEIEKGVSK